MGPLIEIDYDQIGRFYWNPHPKVPGQTTKIEGQEFPLGTLGVVVAGKVHAFPPQDIGKILATEEHFRLILINVEAMVGRSAMNDLGVRQISLNRLAAEGEAYLKEVDTRCANVLMDTLERIYIEGLEKENESRIAKNLPPREPDSREREKLQILDGLAARLKKEKSHELDKRLKVIRTAATIAPNFQATLKEMGIDDLKAKAEIAAIAFDPNCTSGELIAKLTANRVQQERKKIMNVESLLDEPVDEGDGVEDEGETIEELLDSKVSVPEG
jgi:hypothetical protein